MEKLTKEQAEWIMQAMGKEFYSQGMYISGPLETLDNNLDIIRQCTEKEFPAFSVDDIFVGVDERHSELIAIWFTTTPSSDAYWTLDKEQFKAFAAGCNEIVGWIEAQENE